MFPVYEAADSGLYEIKRMPRLPKSTATLVEPPEDRLQIDFFPEGGSLVRGVPTRVAFQARNSDGRTLNVAGALMRGGDSIGYFRSDYAGRGLFNVTADSTDEDELARNLRLRLTYNGCDYSFRLPKSHREGYVLNVFDTPGSLKATVARNELTPGMRLGLSVTCRGRTSYFDVLDLQRSLRSDIIIDKSSLYTGVNIFTLYTGDGEILARRMAFVNNHDTGGWRLSFSSSADSVELKPYGKVTVDCQLCDTAGRPVGAVHNFSMAVTDALSREVTYADDNVLSYLLLSSEIKGFVPHPAYYFEADDREHRAALDMLLMVQGWTRYDFGQMMSGRKFRPLLAVEHGLNFRGRVLDDKGYASREFWKEPKRESWVYAELYAGKDSIFNGELQTADNKFRLDIPDFFGKGRIALVLNKESGDMQGWDKAGIAGHNFPFWKNRRPWFLLGKRIEPLNQYSPLPKNYDYYETAALNDPIDGNVFRDGFMAMPKGYGGFVYYDRKSQSFLVREIMKRKRRGWADFREVRPVSVMDIEDLMTWLSNIYGDIEEFSWSGNAGNVPSWFYWSGIGDVSEADRFFNEISTYENTSSGRHEVMRFGNLRSNYDFDMDNSLSDGGGMKRMLYIFGLDGMNRRFVNADSLGGDPSYVGSIGSKEALPHNMRFFPSDLNFRQLRLYADIDNRKLIYQQGRYLERVYGFDRKATTNDTRPLTSIFNYITDNRYEDGASTPEFMGFRINFQGYTPPVEFYEPDYSRMPLPEQTDYRRTVYWNPDVRTDWNGRARVTFYNNGFSKRIAVSAEGLTADGKPIITE